DVSDGGLLVALAEMAMASGIGATLSAPQDQPAHAFWFGEDQARYVLTCASADALLQAAQKADVPARVVGKTGGAALTLAGGNAISVTDLKRLNEAWLPAYMAQ
ncbi:MAG: phosphoribosylformylglycinamidine synthase II, partial [Alphaproteobacteria bacterium]|nr:phosphoribosylformylglycinamidine synthase II [Alphaproteobacteria bacterium]